MHIHNIVYYMKSRVSAVVRVLLVFWKLFILVINFGNEALIKFVWQTAAGQNWKYYVWYYVLKVKVKVVIQSRLQEADPNPNYNIRLNV